MSKGVTKFFTVLGAAVGLTTIHYGTHWLTKWIGLSADMSVWVVSGVVLLSTFGLLYLKWR